MVWLWFMHKNHLAQVEKNLLFFHFGVPALVATNMTGGFPPACQKYLIFGNTNMKHEMFSKVSLKSSSGFTVTDVETQSGAVVTGLVAFSSVTISPHPTLT